MALPIASIPVLTGEVARQFEERASKNVLFLDCHQRFNILL